MTEIRALPLGDLRILRLHVWIRTSPDEHSDVGCAWESLRIADVGCAGNSKSLADCNLSIALVAVDHDGGNGSRFVEFNAVVGAGFCGRNHVDSFGPQAEWSRSLREGLLKMLRK